MARKRKGNPVHGWIVLDKPYGAGSTAMVGKVRWLLKAQKAGHAGTLDPLATGVLPIALGEATKTVPFMMEADKTYSFEISWGQTRTTHDAEGEVVAASDRRPTQAQIEAALVAFRGEISQIPPRFSAIKIDGQRAYDLARGGQDFEIKPRLTRVERFELTQMTDQTARFVVDCGKGTYIRSLSRDLCAALDMCGYVSFLRRLRVGPFHEGNAIGLDALSELCDRGGVSEALRPVSTALDDIPVLAVTEEDAINLKHGRKIPAPSNMPPTKDLVLVMWMETEIALCLPRDGALVPKRVFNL